MKKTYLFLLTALAFAIFACAIPSEIEVRGSIPKLKFATQTDFSEEFSNIIKDAFGNDETIKKQDCVKVNEVQTFLIHVQAVDQSFAFDLDTGSINTIEIDGVEYNISDYTTTFQFETDAVIFDSDEEKNKDKSITLPLSSLGDNLKGFNFSSDNIEAKLYIYSENEIIENAVIQIRFDKDDNGVFVHGDNPIIINDIVLARSGIDLNLSDYFETSLPSGGYEIDGFAGMLNDNADYQINVKVTLPANKPIQKSWLDDDVKITAELLVWFPLELEARGEGAAIEFPESTFDGVGGFIDSVVEYMEELSLIVEMNKNPFQDGILVMSQSEGSEMLYNIEHSMGAKTLNFKLSDNNMRIIERLSGDFNPKFSVKFDSGDRLSIPRSFNTTNITFSAKISYMLMGDK